MPSIQFGSIYRVSFKTTSPAAPLEKALPDTEYRDWFQERGRFGLRNDPSLLRDLDLKRFPTRFSTGKPSHLSLTLDDDYLLTDDQKAPDAYLGQLSGEIAEKQAQMDVVANQWPQMSRQRDFVLSDEGSETIRAAWRNALKAYLQSREADIQDLRIDYAVQTEPRPTFVYQGFEVIG